MLSFGLEIFPNAKTALLRHFSLEHLLSCWIFYLLSLGAQPCIQINSRVLSPAYIMHCAYGYTTWIIHKCNKSTLLKKSSHDNFFFFLPRDCVLGGYIVTFTNILTIYHFEFIPSIVLLYSLHSWKFQQVSFFHFHTWVHQISTTFSFLYPFIIPPPTLLPTPRQDLFALEEAAWGNEACLLPF
jgi:hypothetical protein